MLYYTTDDDDSHEPTYENKMAKYPTPYGLISYSIPYTIGGDLYKP